jgi:RNA polymerase sigma-70 factor (sigma-E family)
MPDVTGDPAGRLAAVPAAAVGGRSSADPGPGETTFASYVASRYISLLRSAQALTGNRLDAEDLVQTTLAKSYLAWDRIRDKQAADAYVRRTLVNTQRSWWRRRRVDEVFTDVIPEPAAVADPTRDVDAREVIIEALGRLPRRQRTMIVLRFCEDMSEVETAELLGVAVGTVKSSVSRGLAKLRGEPTLRDAAFDRSAATDDGCEERADTGRPIFAVSA